MDGTAIGTSKRTSAWFESMAPDRAAAVTRVYVFHTWAPDSFQTVLDKWVQAGQSIGQLLQSVAGVARVVGAFL